MMFRRRRLGMILILAAIGVVCWGIWLMFLWFFEIKTIEVVGSGLTVNIDQNKITKNLIFFPAAKLRNQILHDQPLISDVIFRKKYPHTLIVEALPREASARLQDGERMALIDRSGVVLGDVFPGNSLPLLIFATRSGLTPGIKIKDKGVLQALNFIEVTKNIFAIENITRADNLSLRAKLRKTEIFFPQEGELHDREATLQTLFTGFRIKGILPSSVDLRFDKPIVIF